MDEGRKRVLSITAILTAMHMRTADDLFGTPQGSPTHGSVHSGGLQWAERIMRKIDKVFMQ